MTTNDKNNHSEAQTEDSQPKDRRRIITVALDDFDDVYRAVRDALGKSKDIAASVGESIRDTIKTVRDTRDSVGDGQGQQREPSEAGRACGLRPD